MSSLPELTHGQYEELIEQLTGFSGGGTVVEMTPAYLHALEVEHLLVPPHREVTDGLRAEWLNVLEPHYYRDQRGEIRLILPLAQDTTYKTLQEVVSDGEDNEHFPWAYMIVSEDDDLEDIAFYFHDGADDHKYGGGAYLPEFELGTTWTH